MGLFDDIESEGRDTSAKDSGFLIKLEEIIIIDWIKNLIPPRDADEQKRLTELIEESGQETPALVTTFEGQKNVLIDGHGRFESLDELGTKTIWVVHREFKDEYAIRFHMLNLQFGRRNLSDNGKSRLRAKTWISIKDKVRDSESLTFEKVADKLGIDKRTLSRDLEFEKSAIKLEEILPESIAFIEDANTQKKDVGTISILAENNPELAKKAMNAGLETTGKRNRSKAVNQTIEEERFGDSESPNKRKRKAAKESKVVTNSTQSFTAFFELDPDLVDRLKQKAPEPSDLNRIVKNLVEEYLTK